MTEVRATLKGIGTAIGWTVFATIICVVLVAVTIVEGVLSLTTKGR